MKRYFLFTGFLLLIGSLTFQIDSPVRAEAPKPVFIIFAAGFWGSMDKLPSKSQAWLDSSPYPHFCKHQEVEYLTGPDYQPIPQRYMIHGRGPSLGLLIINSYYRMEGEFSYWARRVNQQSGRERIKIFPDWEVLKPQEAPTGESGVASGPNAAAGEGPGIGQGAEISEGPEVGDINLIYLKYDWRLDLPRVEKYYARPLLELLDKRWPGAEIHWVGHSLGGVVGRYAAASHPGRLTSLITIGAPHYGIYEIGAQCRGERVTYGGRWDLEYAQQLSIGVVEQIYFGTKIVHSGKRFLASAQEFANRYLPMMQWMQPNAERLADGFGNLAKLKEAVPHAIAIYGLGFGSYDLQGVYHQRFYPGKGIGSGFGPEDGPPEYALSGDGRVDPVSGRGPFTRTLCLGLDKAHGSLMWSPLVMTALLDRYYFNGSMPDEERWWALRRLGATGDQKKNFMKWLAQAREAWDAEN
ncbi:MAG TPA: alpha/beta fold hydrolase [Bacillota bacterium]|nr:alpha/beta fold hydrolase [Bacillota bacterium]